MLKIMENEMEIFRAWLQKYVKDDNRTTAIALAKQIGVSKASMSAYISGRIINGERKFTQIPFKTREKILEITGVAYDQMIKVGRQQLTKAPPSTEIEALKKDINELRKIVSEGPAKKKETEDQIIDFTNDSPAKIEHHKLLKLFPNAEDAFEMNWLAVEYVKRNPNAIKELIKYIRFQLSETETHDSSGKPGIITENNRKNGTDPD